MEKRNSRQSLARKLHPRASPNFHFLFSIFHSRFSLFPQYTTTPSNRIHSPSFAFRFSIFVFFLLAGCGAPGEPVPPSPPVPTAINDLSSRQSGDGVQLTFTMPIKTIHGDRLTETPSIEILRGVQKPDGAPDPKSFRIVDNVPGSLVNNYVSDDRVQFVDHIAPEETRAHPGGTLVYRVRTRVSPKRASPDSNSVSLQVFPVPERITSVQSKLTETAVELTWTAPTHTSAGEALTAAPEYHIYRGQLDPRAHDPASKDLSHDKWLSPLALLRRSDTTSFRDTQFDFGKTYAYIVRSALNVDGHALESDDSDPVVLAAIDTFPPSVPQGLVAAVVSTAPSAAPEVDLSWSINLETDLAGYRVYRSEQPGGNGVLLNPDLLPSPAFRDMSVLSGHHYWYSVTAVDRAGNESAHSAPVQADVAQPSS
jgi:hypothetical protein